MNRRICPQEEILSEYLCGHLPPEDKNAVEEHIAGCNSCRELLSDAYEIISKPDLNQTRRKVMNWIKSNPWFFTSVTAFTFSFVFPRYFLQFLAAGLLAGAKWIIDAKTTKMLIMIYEAWKHGDKDTTDKVLSRFKSHKL
ncbi:MAG: zf-HC2 domain-containing protein [Candidatus Omnitrophota bacterium]